MSTATADLTKVVFNPSKSVTFVPVAKKQMVQVEVTNNSSSDVAVKFKNTGPGVYKTNPPQAKIGVGEKKAFACIFKGLPKEQCKTNDRFTVVFIAASKNVVIEKAWKNAHKTATLKHKISILFQGINDQKENETQPQTNNNEEEDDKDRQGTMRTKKAESKEKTKKATVVMFTRKEGDSLSDEDDVDESAGTGAAGAPSDDMMTTRPAGAFTGQTAANAAPGTPGDDMRTTRPAGTFGNQTTANGGAPVPVDPKNEFKTTRPAGQFQGQVAANPTTGAALELKTTKPAGQFDNQQTRNK